MNRFWFLLGLYILMGVAALFAVLTLIAIIENAVEGACR
jgi:hypothetical protein